MLAFDIRSLEARPARVDAHLGPDDPIWQEGDPLPASPVHVTGRLAPAGAGRFYLSGRFDATVAAECRRCLTPVSAPVSESLHLLFSETDEPDDPDIYRLDPRAHSIDLRAAVREQWLLSVPAFALCDEACEGLCPNCGADLNAGACACAPSTDSRWNALREIRRGTV